MKARHGSAQWQGRTHAHGRARSLAHQSEYISRGGARARISHTGLSRYKNLPRQERKTDRERGKTKGEETRGPVGYFRWCTRSSCRIRENILDRTGSCGPCEQRYREIKPVSSCCALIHGVLVKKKGKSGSLVLKCCPGCWREGSLGLFLLYFRAAVNKLFSTFLLHQHFW